MSFLQFGLLILSIAIVLFYFHIGHCVEFVNLFEFVEPLEYFLLAVVVVECRVLGDGQCMLGRDAVLTVGGVSAYG